MDKQRRKMPKRGEKVAIWTTWAALFVCSTLAGLYVGSTAPADAEPVVYQGLRLDDFGPTLEDAGAEVAIYDARLGAYLLLDAYGREVGRIDMTGEVSR